MSAREGYRNTLIAPASDCSAVAEVPATRGGKLTVATIQYSLLHDAPYGLSQEDILFGTWRAQQALPPSVDTADQRDIFFAKPKACLRASPLGKKFGWGIHFDDDAHAALIDPGSARFAELMDEANINVVHAMRSSRAGA